MPRSSQRNDAQHQARMRDPGGVTSRRPIRTSKLPHPCPAEGIMANFHHPVSRYSTKCRPLHADSTAQRWLESRPAALNRHRAGRAGGRGNARTGPRTFLSDTLPLAYCFPSRHPSLYISDAAFFSSLFITFAVDVPIYIRLSPSVADCLLL